jgi:O-antigen/teichoic acid export membrane protein
VPVQIYIAVSCLIIVNQPLIAILQGKGREQLASRLLVVELLVHLLAAAAGAEAAGASGAALGLLVSNVALTVALAVVLLRRQRPLRLETAV